MRLGAGRRERSPRCQSRYGRLRRNLDWGYSLIREEFRIETSDFIVRVELPRNAVSTALAPMDLLVLPYTTTRRNHT